MQVGKPESRRAVELSGRRPVELGQGHSVLEAGQGDPGSDLAFAYVSTALSFGTSAAEQLLQSYRSRAAWPIHDLAWWQLLAASRLEPDIDTWTRSANFLGPADLTAAEVRRRFNVLIDTSARNLGSAGAR